MRSGGRGIPGAFPTCQDTDEVPAKLEEREVGGGFKSGTSELRGTNEGCSSMQPSPVCFISADLEGSSGGQGGEGKHGPWTGMDYYLVRLLSHEVAKSYYVRVKGPFEMFESGNFKKILVTEPA